MTALASHLLAETPLVVSCHGTELRQLALASALAPYVVPGCSAVDQVLVLHGAHADELDARYHIAPERIAIAAAGFRDDLFRTVERGVGPSPHDGAATVVYAGKLSRSKGLPWLLDALATLPSVGGRRVQLLMAGGGAGPETDAIVRQAALLAPRVRFLGALSQADLARVLQRAHLFVLPSLYEGLPLVVLEALACGCRLVVTALPGLEQWLPPDIMRLELATTVQLPRLVGPDEPHPDAAAHFVRELARALERQLSLALNAPAPSRTALRELLRPYNWQSVFSRVHGHYQRLAGGA